MTLRKIENSIEKIRKDKKAYWLEGSKQVDSQAKALMSKISELRLPHTEAYQELDKLKKEREQKRKDELSARVEYIRELPEMLSDSCSDEILPAMEAMNTEECLDFYEFTQEALKARNATQKSLADLYARKLKEEQEAIELEQLRKEKAEREQKEREDRIAREAAEAARLAEIKRAEDEALKAKQEQEKREANKKYIGKVRKEAKESLIGLGLSEKDSKTIVMAIHNGDIKNVFIKY